MWHADLALALAWFIPILLGAVVGFVLLGLGGGKGDRTERREESANAPMWHL